MAKSKRNWQPCRVCERDHTNPASSSICTECGQLERLEKEALAKLCQTCGGLDMFCPDCLPRWVAADPAEAAKLRSPQPPKLDSFTFGGSLPSLAQARAQAAFMHDQQNEGYVTGFRLARLITSEEILGTMIMPRDTAGPSMCKKDGKLFYRDSPGEGDWVAVDDIIAERDAAKASVNDLRATVLNLIDTWWCFVHGSNPSDTARGMLNRATDALHRIPPASLREVKRGAYVEGFCEAINRTSPLSESITGMQGFAEQTFDDLYPTGDKTNG